MITKLKAVQETVQKKAVNSTDTGYTGINKK